MTNFSDNDLGNNVFSDPRDAVPADKPNLASKKVSDFYDSWVDKPTNKPVRRDVQNANPFFKMGGIYNYQKVEPVHEGEAYLHEFEKLLEKMNNRNNFSSTEHWMHEVDRFTSAMCEEIIKTRQEILQKTARTNANKLLLSEVLVESAEACDPIEPLTLTFGGAKQCSEFLQTMVSRSKVEFDKSMSGHSRDPSKAAGAYRFIKPKTR